MKNLIWGFILIIGTASISCCCDPIEGWAYISNNSNDTIVAAVNYQYPGNIANIEGFARAIFKDEEKDIPVWEGWDDTKIRQIVIIKIIGNERGEVVGTLDVSYKEYGARDSYFIYPDDFNPPTDKIVLPISQEIKRKIDPSIKKGRN